MLHHIVELVTWPAMPALYRKAARPLVIGWITQASGTGCHGDQHFTHPLIDNCNQHHQRLTEKTSCELWMHGFRARTRKAAAAQDQNENVHAFVMVGLHTSMRHSEILAICRDDIDLARHVIWIPKAKAGAREQPITVELEHFLVRFTHIQHA